MIRELKFYKGNSQNNRDLITAKINTSNLHITSPFRLKRMGVPIIVGDIMNVRIPNLTHKEEYLKAQFLYRAAFAGGSTVYIRIYDAFYREKAKKANLYWYSFSSHNGYLRRGASANSNYNIDGKTNFIVGVTSKQIHAGRPKEIDYSTNYIDPEGLTNLSNVMPNIIF